MDPRPATAPPPPGGPPTPDAMAALLPQVQAALRAPAWHLVFPAPLEARHEADHGRARSRQLVLAGLAALLVYDLFLINDWFTRPDVMVVALQQRLGVMTASSLVVLGLIHRGLPPRWREGLLATVLVLGMATSCEIFRQTQSAAAQYDPFLFSLVFVAGNIVFPLRFRAAALSSLASLLLAALAVVGSPRMPLAAQCFAMGLMLATAVFTCLACYRIERATRQAYLLLLQEALRSQTAQRLADEYAVISQTDALTGLPNRRAFDAALQQRWLEARSRGTGLALLVVDVDHFKRYNDHHGHPAGDACLRRVAQAMAGAVREGDLLARIGGEEFVLLLRDGRPASATAAAERLRHAVQAMALPHGGVAGDAVVTVSIGVAAQQPRPGADPAGLLAAADQALYLAKQCGRNRWMLAGGPGAPGAPAAQAAGRAEPHCAQ